MTWNPWKKIRLLQEQIKTLKIQLDCAVADRNQAVEDLRAVVAQVAIVQSSGSSLIKKEHYLRMGRGGES